MTVAVFRGDISTKFIMMTVILMMIMTMMMIIIIIIIITSHSRVPLDKLKGPQLFKKFPAFYGNYEIRRRGVGTDDSFES